MFIGVWTFVWTTVMRRPSTDRQATHTHVYTGRQVDRYTVFMYTNIKLVFRGGSRGGGGVSRGLGPPPPPFWGTPKIQKE